MEMLEPRGARVVGAAHWLARIAHVVVAVVASVARCTGDRISKMHLRVARATTREKKRPPLVDPHTFSLSI